MNGKPGWHAGIDVATVRTERLLMTNCPKKIRIEPSISSHHDTVLRAQNEEHLSLHLNFILRASQNIWKWPSIIRSCSSNSKSQPRVKRTPHRTCLVDGGSLHHFSRQNFKSNFSGPPSKAVAFAAAACAAAAYL